MLLKSLSSSGTRFVSRTNTQMLSGLDSTIRFSPKQSVPAELQSLTKEELNMSDEVRRTAPEPEFAALVAIDWADKKHVWTLEAVGTGQRERGELEHTPEAIEAWASNLAARFGGRPIGVGLEQSRGSLLYTLTK